MTNERDAAANSGYALDPSGLSESYPIASNGASTPGSFSTVRLGLLKVQLEFLASRSFQDVH